MIACIRKFFNFAILCSAIWALPALADDAPQSLANVRSVMIDIDAAVRAGRLVQADAMLSWIEQGNDQTLANEIAFLRAEYHMAGGDANLAAEALERAGKDVGDQCRHSRLSGWIAGKAAQWNNAILQLASAVESCPVDPALWNFLGLALVGKGEFAAALEAFDSALALEPQQPALLNNRALALVGTGQHHAALTDLHRAIALDAGDRAIRNNADYLSGVLGIEPERSATDSDAIWASRLARTGDGARDAKRDRQANALFANAALLTDRFDAHIWAQNSAASIRKAD